jgi:hypothetical protein
MKLAGTAILGLVVVLVVGSTLSSQRGDESAATQEVELACITMRTERMPLDTRRSPLDSVSFEVQGGPVKVCYSRPSAREREVMGGLLAYGEIWRTGANEPTMIHTSVALEIAGVGVEPGSYSIYTVPGENEWQVVVNGSITQWGHERNYVGEVAAQEIGRGTVASGATEEYVEMFTIRSEPGEGGSAFVILEWEETQVRIPVLPAN